MISFIGRAAMLVGGAGLVADIVQRLSKEISKRGGREVFLHLITTSQALPGKIADLVIEEVSRLKYMYAIEVDPSVSLLQAIQKADFKEVHQHLLTPAGDKTKGRSNKKYRVSVVLFGADRDSTTEGVLADMKHEGFRPATPLETVVLKMTHPDLMQRGGIVSLSTEGLSEKAASQNFMVLDTAAMASRCWLYDNGIKWSRGALFVGVRIGSEQDVEEESCGQGSCKCGSDPRD